MKGDWSSWGGAREASSALPTPFGWGGAGGMQSEGETGLIYAQQRYYSPKLGRFLSRDPLGFSGGLHPYAYCDNDPHNRTDPDGLDWIPKGLGDLIGWTGRGIGQALKGLDDAVGSLAGAAVDAVNAATRPTMVSGTPTLGNAQYGGGKEGAPQRKAMHRAGRALNDAIDGVEKGIAKEALYQAMGGALHAAGTLAEEAQIARAAESAAPVDEIALGRFNVVQNGTFEPSLAPWAESRDLSHFGQWQRATYGLPASASEEELILAAISQAKVVHVNTLQVDLTAAFHMHLNVRYLSTEWEIQQIIKRDMLGKTRFYLSR